MIIESIQRSRHRKGRILVYLADGSVLKITEQELLDFGLRPGDDIDDGRLQALKEAAGVSDVRSAAADLIGRRAMSRAELEQKLRRKGASENDARYAAEWLEAIGALNDGEYAALLARHYAAMGYGPARVREKLREKGIPRELWDDALDTLPDSGGQIDRFLAAKLRGVPPDEKEKKRLSDALARRGYGWSDIQAAWRRYGSAIEEQ